MKKIPSIFVRLERSNVVDTDKVTPGCEWVFTSLLTNIFITVKRDGAPMLYRHGLWYQRRELKSRLDPGIDGIPKPLDFTPCQPAPSYDDESKQWEWPGWVPLDQQNRKLVDEAIISRGGMKDTEDGFTYELCGPKVVGNPEGWDTHHLFAHASERIIISAQETLLTLAYLYLLLKSINHQGIVIYNGQLTDSGMQCAKLKKRDLGLDWPVKAEAKN